MLGPCDIRSNGDSACNDAEPQENFEENSGLSASIDDVTIV